MQRPNCLLVVLLFGLMDDSFAHNVTKRQTPTFICVPPGTCIVTGGVVDPRIITPTGQTPTQPPATCPAGTVPCFPVSTGATCGTRYVTNAGNQPGNSVYGAFPWQAFIRNQTGYTGSGVLLDSFTVLTAAHKVYDNRFTPNNILVNMGVWDPVNLAATQQRTVVNMVIHPNFSATTLRNDIAVLRLSAPISLGYQINVGSGCLPAAGTSYVGRTCVVSGWGRSGFNINDAPTNPQKQVFVPIVDYNTCRASMAQANVLGTNVDIFLDNANELCAGGVANNDACTLDGGAPLMCQDGNVFYVAGLVIWGRGCGQPGVFGVYVNVPAYRGWIDQAVASLSFG